MTTVTPREPPIEAVPWSMRRARQDDARCASAGTRIISVGDHGIEGIHLPSGPGRTGHRQRERRFVSAPANGLDILRCFDRPAIELTVADLARRVGLNQSTAWRLFYTLIECGYLVRVVNGPALRDGTAAVTLRSCLPAPIATEHLD